MLSKAFFFHKTILVTGGTGSFGKFIVGELLKTGVSEVRILSRDEDKQYSMQHDFRKHTNLRFIIGDIRDKETVVKATKGVDYVFHAAALKQIPSSEYNIMEVVKTNVLGAQNVVDACLTNNVKKALAISTDKAVEPINVMGMTKALQERVFILANTKTTHKKASFSCVRYGNVIASRGSVIPLFIKQIQEGGPLTMTDEQMTRFILTLRQATELVFAAITTMIGGEVFVPKIQPIRIIDLANVLIEELHPKNTRILTIGIRPGEKLHETLVSLPESLTLVDKKDYFILLPQIKLEGIGYVYKASVYKKTRLLEYSSDKGPFLSKKEIRAVLHSDGII